MGLSDLKLATKILMAGAGPLSLMSLLGTGFILAMDWGSGRLQQMARDQLPATTLVQDFERQQSAADLSTRLYELTNETELLVAARKDLEAERKVLERLKAMVAASPNLGLLGQSIPQLEAKLAEQEQLMETVRTAKEGIAKARLQLADQHDAFEEMAYGYRQAQWEGLEKALSRGAVNEGAERMRRLSAIDEAILTNGRAHELTLTAQLWRDPEMLADAHEELQLLAEGLDKLRATPHQEAELEQLGKAIQAGAEYRETTVALKDRWAAGMAAGSRRTSLSQEGLELARNIARTNANDTLRASGELSELMTTLLELTVLALGVAFVGGAVGTTVLSRSISRPVDRIVQGLTAAASQVTQVSSQVASSSQQLATAASAQAAKLEEVASSLEEVSSMTRQNADNAHRADELARETGSSARKSSQSMTRMSESIQKIHDSSQRTAGVVKAIDAIAFQTNLLALNAAVEAARAGDLGRGFAVVAEEVRSLSHRSASAAKETTELVDQAQRDASGGVQVAGEARQSLSHILASSETLTSLVADVAAASAQQASGVQQISGAIAHLDSVTQTNAAVSEESAAASEQLSAQARELNEMVAALDRVVKGGRGAARREVDSPNASQRGSRRSEATPSRLRR